MDNRGPVLPVAALAALQDGNKIQAIKLVREAHGLGLKEAHDAVQSHIARHPELQTRFAAGAERTKRGCLAAILVGSAVAAGVIVWLITT